MKFPQQFSTEECFHEEVEMVHNCHVGVCLENPNIKSKPHSPRDEKRASNAEDPTRGSTERLLVFLDDSGSMQSLHRFKNGTTKLELAKRQLFKIMPRLSRTPTEVHFIRCNPAHALLSLGFCAPSSRAFGVKDDFIYEDVEEKWKAGYGTFLWEYIYEVVDKVFAPHIEVVIITDGYDMHSSAQFAGPQGFDHMMQLLTKANKRPRFRVLCIGNDACTGMKMSYRDLALATGGNFGAVWDDSADDVVNQAMVLFADHVNSAFDEREANAIEALKRYQFLIEQGEAEKYPWALALLDSGSGSSRRPHHSVGVGSNGIPGVVEKVI